VSVRDRRVPIADVARYAERIDVRSPAEFALDRLPRAVNAPVLDDAERARVGTLHAQVSAFEARKVGAAIVARNIAAIVDTLAREKTVEWSPLVYCWRGGQRSRALAHVLGEIGFGAVQLEGGYRAFRRHVVAALASRPAALRFVVVGGLTGAGKSRLIAALAAEGAQVLDLERLARHRGSLLGDDPHHPQPSQKAFETGIYDALERVDPAEPVFVESESRRIGRLQLPPALLAAMRASPCLRLDSARALRIELLIEDYAHLCADPATLDARLAPLAPLVGSAALARWRDAAAAGEFATLVDELLSQHYDPVYARSIDGNYPQLASAPVLTARAIDAAAYVELAREAVAVARRAFNG
jgi:tRNA 2-selenouridine synthase